MGQQAFRTNRTSRSLATYAFWASSVEVPLTESQASLDPTPTTNKWKQGLVSGRQRIGLGYMGVSGIGHPTMARCQAVKDGRLAHIN